jgi:transcriptional regulator with XRE-family HTH domain
LAGYYLWHKDYERARQLLSPSLSQEAEMTGGICFMAADLYRETGPADSTRYYCKLLLQNEETGLRQMGHKWLAEQLDKDPATVSKWCTNSCQPSLETLVNIAKVLEVDMNELIRFEN